MPTIDEKRVYDDTTDPTRALIAAADGVIEVSISGDRVGEFELVHSCTARDISLSGESVAVATARDVLVDFEPTNHGEAEAVGRFMGSVIAIDPEGTVSWYNREEWEPVGIVKGARRIDDELIASEEGVFRLAAGNCESVGLTDVRDVASSGIPLAAAANGLYALGNGWIRERDGAFRTVTADRDGRQAHAATADALYERVEAGTTAVARTDDTAGKADENGESQWRVVEGAGDDITDIAYDDGLVVAVTDAGEVRTSLGEEWRERTLGIREARTIVVR